jgi:hypothetical protein
MELGLPGRAKTKSKQTPVVKAARNARADRLKEELLAIQKADRKKILSPQKALVWAKANPKSELHSRLEWDNHKAADEYRLWQVRALIADVVVTSEAREPVFVNLSTDRPNGGGYRTVADVEKDRDLSQVMLNDALNELNRAKKRWERVKPLERVWKEVDRASAKAKRLN